MKKITERFRQFYGKHTPSVKLPMVAAALIFCMIPLLIQSRVLSSSSRQQQIDRRIIDVQNQCQILSNKMSRGSYLTNSVVDNASLDSELSTLADIFNGRILIVNSGFRVVRDTFSLSEGKICISEEVIRCFQGESTNRYDTKRHYFILAIPIPEYVQSTGGFTAGKTAGVMLVTASTESMFELEESLNDRAALYQLMIFVVLSIVIFSVVHLLIRPFERLVASVGHVAEGNLDEDIALALGVKDVRIVTLEDAVGIEVANKRPSIVPLKFMLNDDSFRNNRYELPVAIGVTITNKVKVFDLADAPHLLVAGATKQGKSVCLNVIITSLLYSKHPSELKFVFIDPKRVEFTLYSSLIHHYLAVLPDAVSEKDEMDNAIVKKPKQAEMILKSLCIEMDERYDLLSNAEVRNVKDYNNKYMDRHLLPTDGHKYMPYIVVVIDEYADLIMASDTGGESKSISKNIMDCIIRLAQKGRAAGIHLILATQRPSTNVVTGLIKGNFPTRIAFRVSQRMDSMVILDSTGAEKLILDFGDAWFLQEYLCTV